MIKYIKSALWRVAKCLSYIEEARCLKVNTCHCTQEMMKKKSLSCFNNMNVPTSYINATKLRKHATEQLLYIVNGIPKIRPKHKVS